MGEAGEGLFIVQKSLLIILFVCCLGSVNAQTAKEWRDSVSYLSQLIEQNPKDLELRMRKAECNIMLDQWQYALDEYTNVLDLYPTHIGALYFRAYVNKHLKRYAFARADYEKVLTYEPGHEGALTGLILTNVEDNHLTKAYDDSNLLVELYPGKPKSYATRAQVEEAIGLIDTAIADVTTAIEMEGEKLSSNTRLSAQDEYVQYVINRISLYRKKMAALKKKSDDFCLDAIDADKKLLLSRGLPSRWVKSLK